MNSLAAYSWRREALKAARDRLGSARLAETASLPPIAAELLGQHSPTANRHRELGGWMGERDRE
ncbi:hypothetical protein TAL182_PE00008 (plasmid) [Rhizobium sp. TAL182]|nr:hypothetical protein TAL182_PE00008 [Rhizobium sp. TAL182]